LLSVNQLYFLREDKALFENISFALRPGELLQIQGVNGAGKTTLLKLLAGFLRPDSGEIIFKDKIAYLGHAPAFTSWLTVEENIKITAELYHHDVQEVSAVLGQFSLQVQAAFFPHQLSEGQRRRLAFGLLSLSRARLWLLDEPFAALDRQAFRLIQSLILEHLAVKGIVVMSTHQEIAWPVPISQMILGESNVLCTPDF
jgi:heme exporter protein A